ncbi:MAG: glycosyltransferase family 2 protein [Patescibacteria group bacterium]|jgi:hypothetical protein
MNLSIVIVSWNVKRYLQKCISVLAANRDRDRFEVIVVDNASTDGTQSMVAQEFPWVTLIKNKNNEGFASANNTGLSFSRGKYILFLNPDTEAALGEIQKLENVLDVRPEVSAVGPQLFNTDGSLQKSVLRFPTALTLYMYVLKLHGIFKNNPVARKYFAMDFDYQKSQSVDQIMGACMLVRKSALDAIGGWDSKYFVWFEEVDLCYRMKKAGLTIWYDADAHIIHHFGRSFDQLQTVEKQRQFNQSALRFAKKHLGFFAWVMLVFLTPLGILLAYVQQFLGISYAKN